MVTRFTNGSDYMQMAAHPREIPMTVWGWAPPVNMEFIVFWRSLATALGEKSDGAISPCHGDHGQQL